MMDAVVTATLILRERPGGTSQTRFVCFDDGFSRLVKWNWSSDDASFHGAHSCYNELVASRIAQLLRAPVLPGAIVNVGRDTAFEDPSEASPLRPGLHFGADRLAGRDFKTRERIECYATVDELASAAVFLAWLKIADIATSVKGSEATQDGGVFLRSIVDASGHRALRYVLVDLEGAFKGAKWNRDTFNEQMLNEEQLLPPHMKGLEQAQLDPHLQALLHLDEAAIRGCFASYPEEWSVTQAERLAAEDWTIQRARLLGKCGRKTPRSISVA